MAVPPVEAEGAVCSSTRIREALADGEVALAGRLLAGPTPSRAWSGPATSAGGRSASRPRTLTPWAGARSFPPPESMPCARAYAGATAKHLVSGRGQLRPTADRGRTDVAARVHLLEGGGDLYGERLRVAFLERLRGEQKFASLDELKAQIARDVERARAIHGPSRPEPDCRPMSPDYRDTVFLPRPTSRCRRACRKREPELARPLGADGPLPSACARREPARPFVLHDGPPYANGAHPHRPRAEQDPEGLRRPRARAGLRRDYVPGWDCHGLPIEWKIEEEYRAKGSARTRSRWPSSARNAATYAAHWIDVQREEFKRLGVHRRLGEPLRHHGLPRRGGDRRASSTSS